MNIRKRGSNIIFPIKLISRLLVRISSGKRELKISARKLRQKIKLQVTLYIPVYKCMQSIIKVVKEQILKARTLTAEHTRLVEQVKARTPAFVPSVTSTSKGTRQIIPCNQSVWRRDVVNSAVAP